MTSSIQTLSVLVPCFNEEGNISRFENELFAPLESQPFNKEYIFIDDGSLDHTYENLLALQQTQKKIKIFRHHQNQGLGAALKTGINGSLGDAILTLDSDLTFAPREFPILLEAYTETVDCVMGSPSKGKFEGVSFYRRFLSQGVNFLYRVLLGQSLSSTSCIFRLYRAKTLKELNLGCNSFDINAEIVAKLLFKKKKIKEVPVTLRVRKWGVSKIRMGREILNHLRLLGKILFWRII